MENVVRKLFRNPDDKKIAGVCSGLAVYFGLDVTIIRIVFLAALIFGFTGFWIYLIVWIVAPEAKTPVEKCELRGLPTTEENLQKFSNR
jgi:phage shock protein PspC (stress-responsive transcriptional regulator)